MTALTVTPAKAGVPLPSKVRSGIPAFAGMTILWLLAVLFMVVPAAAQTFPPNNGSPVVDQAGILTPAQVADLQSKAQALYAQTGRAFAVATVKSLEGYPVEDYAYRLGRAWGLGEKGKDNGVLLLVAPNEHKVDIATGYGAGAYMTDAMSGLIIREAILPHFKQNPPDYGGGIEAGADAIIKQMSLSPDQAEKNIAAAQQAQQQRQHSSGGGLPVFFWLMIMGFVVLSHFRRGYGRRYRTRGGGISPWVMLWGLNALGRGGGGWGGGGGGGFGGGGGGFGGFGGGSFGGGGASGSW
ncbi:MAG TPA: TPM domain-containing protein [Sphingomicrobium sp.]|nr:TPM domain-containing protein [Sphingomicrobium sp.]